MADSREPPPLFDEDDSSRKDDENDIFASAVQSPMNDEVTPASSQVTANHPLLEPKETEVSEENAQSKPIISTKHEQHDLLSAHDDGSLNDDLMSVSLNSEQKSLEQVRNDKIIADDDFGKIDFLGDGGEDYNLIDHTINNSLTGANNTKDQTNNASNQINSTSTIILADDTLVADDVAIHEDAMHFLSDLDTTEILLHDNTLSQEISLQDEEDDLFHSTVASIHQPPTQQQPTAPAFSVVNTLPTVGAPLYEPSPQVSKPTIAVSPIEPAPITSTSAEQIEKDGGDTFITISVSDPQKIGDGMGSYMAYKVTTNTNITYFRKGNWGVTRRFSDFLGLHSKLVEKHLHSGVIIPPAPEKAAIATTKIKLGSDKNSDIASVEFIERRRAALERYMNRTASHPKLRADPDFREFIELDAELPKATQTSAISSAGVLRLFNRVGETVNKMAFKMDESDQWFEEKTQHIESLDTQLRKLHAAMEGLVGYRRELANATGSFSNSAAILSSVEEHSALSRALHQLSEATDRVHTIHHSQADADFFHLSETTKDYINIIGAVKEVFHERVKTYQTWQHAQATLAKKRENKAKSELTGRIDKVEQANEEVREWETKVDRSQEEFERISTAIKSEMEQFDVIRIVDFKEMLVKYLEALITSQMQIVKVWETFLPEAKAIA